MPIYEYQCDNCARIEEAIQRFSDPPLTVCPECGGNLAKLISQSSFHLKGSGWYVTDYADKKPGSEPAAKTADGGSSGETAKSGSDTASGDASAAPSSGKADA